MKDVFADKDRAIATYRYSVSQLIPALTKAAWRDKHEEIVQLRPAMERERLRLRVRARRPTSGSTAATISVRACSRASSAFMYRIVPKIGPLKPLSFKAPTPEVEALFARSFRDASAPSRRSSRGGHAAASPSATPTSTPAPGTARRLRLADETWDERLERPGKHDSSACDHVLRAGFRAFYGDQPKTPAASRARTAMVARLQRRWRPWPGFSPKVDFDPADMVL